MGFNGNAGRNPIRDRGVELEGRYADPGRLDRAAARRAGELAALDEIEAREGRVGLLARLRRLLRRG